MLRTVRLSKQTGNIWFGLKIKQIIKNIRTKEYIIQTANIKG